MIKHNRDHGNEVGETRSVVLFVFCVQLFFWTIQKFFTIIRFVNVLCLSPMIHVTIFLKYRWIGTKILSATHYKSEGLTSTNYTVISKKILPLVTLIKVDLRKYINIYMSILKLSDCSRINPKLQIKSRFHSPFLMHSTFFSRI